MDPKDFLSILSQMMTHITTALAFILPKLSYFYMQFPTITTLILACTTIWGIYKVFIRHFTNVVRWSTRFLVALTAIYVYNRGVHEFYHTDLPFLKELVTEHHNEIFDILRSCLKFAWSTVPVGQRIVIDKSLKSIGITVDSVYDEIKNALKTAAHAAKG
ncbi:hypothetical protein ACO0QE_004496 [Hanseniaspora vineae]